MNDGAFPRDQRPPGFDLMADDFRPGDRVRRADDRYLFLETLLSARSNLYISYTGRDSRDNAPLPPSVLVSELLDYVESAFVAADGGTLAGQFPLQHPLQAFNPDYFRPGGALFSYSVARAEAARSLLEPSVPVPDLVPDRLREPRMSGDGWNWISWSPSLPIRPAICSGSVWGYCSNWRRRNLNPGNPSGWIISSPTGWGSGWWRPL